MDEYKAIIGVSDNRANIIKEHLRENVEVVILEKKKLFEQKTVSLGKEWFYILTDEEETTIRNRYGSDINIIDYDRFNKTTFLDPVKGLICPDRNYEGIIFGMSHSQCGINTNYLNKRYYKASAPSLDLFLNYKMLDRLEQKANASINDIIIELPYYIFNYDLSRFTEFVQTKLYYFYLVGDYHHIKETDQGLRIIKEYTDYIKIFKSSEEVIRNGIYTGNIVKQIYRGMKVARKRDKVWYSLYESTILENVGIFSKYLTKLRMLFPKANIRILVMPFNPIFRRIHSTAIERHRNTFYKIMKDNKCTVIDEFDFIKRSSLFNDHCHLNDKGIEYYSSHLKELL